MAYDIDILIILIHKYILFLNTIFYNILYYYIVISYNLITKLHYDVSTTLRGLCGL